MATSLRPVGFNLRALLLALGMGDFNATGVITIMLMPPASTDPDMPPVILLTRRIQIALNKMGAGLTVSGALDQPTADVVASLTGSGYLQRPWYNIVEAVLGAQRRGHRFQAPTQQAPLSGIASVPMSAVDLVTRHPLPAAAVALGLYLTFRKR